MKLSIITINYNNLEGLKKTVDSVLSQTWRYFEWIIVDGGSTDGSKEYIESLALSLSEGTAIDSVQWHVERFSLPGFTAEDLKTQKKESSLDQSSNHSLSIDNRSQRLLWCSEPDKGVYNAMNKGIAMAQGEYLNFMNSGDCFYENDTLQKVFSEKRQSDILYGDWLEVFPQTINVGHFPHPVSIYHFYDHNICHQSMFVKSVLLKKCGYDETSYKYLSDWAKWIDFALDGKSFGYLDICVCRYDMCGLSNKYKMECLSEIQKLKDLKYPICVRNAICQIEEYDTLWYYKIIRNAFQSSSLRYKMLKWFVCMYNRFFIQMR